jgi:hypothetical protein
MEANSCKSNVASIMFITLTVDQQPLPHSPAQGTAVRVRMTAHCLLLCAVLPID